MKKKIRLWAGLVGLVILISSFAIEKENNIAAPVSMAKFAMDEDASTFLKDMVDARMMDIAEGKLARDRGTTPEIRTYGKWMVKDQTILLKELKRLALAKGIIPGKLSEEKAKALADLKKETGEDFDDKFVKMITIDHKRDVREFKKATEFKDEDVKRFAVKFLPAIESHLEKIREIRSDERDPGTY